MKKTLFFFGLLGWLNILAFQFCEAATYYISPIGNDSNSGTQEQPFATFTNAFSKMVGGDTLYIMDGVYYQQIKGMPSGSQENYTKIHALNDHKVDIDGRGTLSKAWQALLYIENKSYIDIQGIKVHSAGLSTDVFNITNSDHINVRVSGFWDAWDAKYFYPVVIRSSSDILLEDVWAFGTGRYTIALGQDTTRTTLRRCITRWDKGSYIGEPIAGFSVYKAYGNIIENSITLDHNDSEVGHTAGHQGFYTCSWATDMPESKDNIYVGNMAINLPYGGVENVTGFMNQTFANTDPDNNLFKDNLAINTYNGFAINSASRGITMTNNGTINVDNVSYFTSSSAVNTIFRNNFAVGSSRGEGFMANGELNGNFLGAHNNAGENFSGFTPANSVITSPDILYPLQIEPGSSFYGTGENDTNIGPNITKRYVDGILTNEDLWPWPYEDWIKEDMCAADPTRGFCGSETLTKYVWEYLGNTIPAGIYSNKPTIINMTIK